MLFLGFDSICIHNTKDEHWSRTGTRTEEITETGLVGNKEPKTKPNISLPVPVFCSPVAIDLKMKEKEKTFWRKGTVGKHDEIRWDWSSIFRVTAWWPLGTAAEVAPPPPPSISAISFSCMWMKWIYQKTDTGGLTKNWPLFMLVGEGHEGWTCWASLFDFF